MRRQWLLPTSALSHSKRVVCWAVRKQQCSFQQGKQRATGCSLLVHLDSGKQRATKRSTSSRRKGGSRSSTAYVTCA